MSDTRAYYARAYARPDAAPPAHRTAVADIGMTWESRVVETDALQTTAADSSWKGLAAAVDREGAPREHLVASRR